MAYVPPYGSNGALYLRPLMFGSGARIGLQPAEEVRAGGAKRRLLIANNPFHSLRSSNLPLVALLLPRPLPFRSL